VIDGWAAAVKLDLIPMQRMKKLFGTSGSVVEKNGHGRGNLANRLIAPGVAVGSSFERDQATPRGVA